MATARLLAQLIRQGFPEATAKKILSGELPMDQASRMARAKEQGLDVDVFHGTNSDIGSYGEGFDAGSYVAFDPEYSSYYAKGDNANVMPLRMNQEGIIDTRAGQAKAWWDEFRGDRKEWITKHDSGLPDHNDEPRFLDWLLTSGKIADLPPSILVDENNGHIAAKIYDPSKIRSLFADFDPAKKESSNILASAAPAAVGLGALAASDDSEAGATGLMAKLIRDSQDDSTVRAPKNPKTAMLATMLRDGERAVEGSPAEFVYPSGLAPWLERLAYDEKPSKLETAMAIADFM